MLYLLWGHRPISGIKTKKLFWVQETRCGWFGLFYNCGWSSFSGLLSVGWVKVAIVNLISGSVPNPALISYSSPLETTQSNCESNRVSKNTNTSLHWRPPRATAEATGFQKDLEYKTHQDFKLWSQRTRLTWLKLKKSQRQDTLLIFCSPGQAPSERLPRLTSWELAVKIN